VLVSNVCGVELGSDFESMAKLWLCNKWFGVVNMASAAVCWGIWKLQNLLCYRCYTVV
jgi:hypothetical protein